ncbi:MAG: response regulator transcription factor [Bacteroidetes bacterium]|nr:response regulator transcription factor [Bacteroidota bacterium]
MANEAAHLNFLLVDDHMIVRTGLKILISQEFFGSNIDEAENTSSAKKWLDKKEYDLIILDVNIPDDNVFDFVIYIKAKNETQKILMFSMNCEEMYAKKFLKLGVKGYLSKQSSDTEVKRAISLVVQNRTYMSESLQSIMVEGLSSSETNTMENPFDSLTGREFEIVALLLKGESTKEIGQILNLQISTVSTHKAHIFEKLKIKNPLQLAELARLHKFDTSP